MPEKIEISTKLIALVTAIIVLISAVVTFRKKNDNAQSALPAEKKTGSIDTSIWELVNLMAAMMVLMLLGLGGMIAFLWLSRILTSMK